MILASRLNALLLMTAAIIAPQTSSAAIACGQPDQWSIAGAIDLAANGVTSAGGTHTTTVPPSLLAAIGWVESNWRQFNAHDTPLLSPDFGYGIMQITSGMAGAFGEPSGSIPAPVQSRIASDYGFNVAYGARILADKWATTPRIGTGDPTVLEDWYYAVWAYNGWGFVNNPNNPRFTRSGTPTTNPNTWPYQERVLYLVAHPPRDAQGNPLWRPVPVSLPSRSTIGTQPASFTPSHLHREAVEALSAVYFPGKMHTSVVGTSVQHTVHLLNTGTEPWTATGSNAVQLTYHLFSTQGDPWKVFSPFSPGVLSYGQHPVALTKDVLPGQSVTLSETMQAPSTPGKYRVVWDLQEGSNVWFSQLLSLPRVSPWHVVSSSSTAPPSPPAVTPTSTPQAIENLAYIADTASADGTRVQAGSVFSKGWLVFNSGLAPWSSGWRLVRVRGHGLGVNSVSVPPTQPCASANILASLTAPSARGTYRSVWRLRDPGGVLVGQKLTVMIQVTGGGRPGSTPIPTPSPTPTHHQGPTPTPTPVG